MDVVRHCPCYFAFIRERVFHVIIVIQHLAHEHPVEQFLGRFVRECLRGVHTLGTVLDDEVTFGFVGLAVVLSDAHVDDHHTLAEDVTE